MNEYLVSFQIYRLKYKLKMEVKILKVQPKCLLIRLDFILEL
jgi:hypothetical protein